MRPVGLAETLFAFVESRKGTPFQWGVHDCSLFPADWALTLLGVDYAEPVRGYTTREEAEQRIAIYGGMTEMVSALMDREPIPTAMARRGDVVLALIEGRETLGICMGVQCAFAQIGAGVTMHPMSFATKAWRLC